MVTVAMATAAGMIGSVAVMRRMALASDALSHVALPGIAVAMLLKLNPLVGGLAALLLGTLLIWAIERRTHIPTEAVTGVIFSAALAAGAMLTPQDDLVAALFGAPQTLGGAEIVFALASSLLVIGFVVMSRSQLIIRLMSPDLARTSGINVPRLDLLFLLAFALTIALGLRYLGVLLMGSLVIIPAATAMVVARDLRRLQVVAVVVAVISALTGRIVAPPLELPAGPTTITIAAAIFVASLFFRQRFRSGGPENARAVRNDR